MMQNFALLASVFIVATCGLGFELVAGAVASYLRGDSVTQFSLVIGIFMSSMGVGSFLSRYVVRRLTDAFVQIEILLGFVGGLSAPVMFLGFNHVEHFQVLLYFFVVCVGVFAGLEIPLLLRILKDRIEFKDLVSQVLGIDYLGALAASVLFPLFLVPKLGMLRTSVFFGMANLAVALVVCHVLRDGLTHARRLKIQATCALVALGIVFAAGDALMASAETAMYSDQVIFTTQSHYQRIVLTRQGDDFRLFLNGHLQFSSMDEYRYHEALVHPGLARVAADARGAPLRVLVLGGGDGLAVREILRHSTVEAVTLVDLDPEMTRLFSERPFMARFNGGAFASPKVRTINADAFVWLKDNPTELFDFVVVDFPDPNTFSLGKLYTTSFYREVARHLRHGGRFVVQSTSPLFARKSFWCIDATLREVGLATSPYHVYVPSFGEWGFILAGSDAFVTSEALPEDLRFLNAATQEHLFQFPRDMERVPTEANKLSNQILVQYYDSEWQQVTQ